MRRTGRGGVVRAGGAVICLDDITGLHKSTLGNYHDEIS